jgi:ribose transport system permease protein
MTDTEPIDHTEPLAAGAQTDESNRSASRLRQLLGSSLGRFSGLILWALIILLFALWIPDKFLTGSSFQSIAGGQAITAVMAIALVFPLSAGQFDISAPQNLGFIAVLVGGLMTKAHLDPVLAIIIGLGAGTAVGGINGFFVTRVGVSSVVTTLGMSSLLLAAAEWLANGAYFGPFPTSFTSITSPHPLGIPIVVIYVVVFAALAWWFLEHTASGRRLHATGANQEAARLAGVRTGRLLTLSFMVAGFGAAVGGILLASSVNSADQTLGPSYLLPAYAGAFLGATQIKPGRFNIWGTLIAIYLLETGVEGLQLVGASLWVTDLFNGAALLGAVSVAIVVEKRRKRTAEVLAGAESLAQATPSEDPLSVAESR